MIGQRYREKKTAVLDVWRRYQSTRGQTEDGVDPALLELRAKALEEGRYVLAVVGETKAGKSTLINALLGERILPTDVLQSSSAIVEIFKSDEKFVEVRYADGSKAALPWIPGRTADDWLAEPHATDVAAVLKVGHWHLNVLVLELEPKPIESVVIRDLGTLSSPVVAAITIVP